MNFWLQSQIMGMTRNSRGGLYAEPANYGGGVAKLFAYDAGSVVANINNISGVRRSMSQRKFGELE